MKQDIQNIVEGNYLIAFFDGRKKTNLNEKGKVTIWWSDTEKMDNFQWKEKDLQYHSSWDWLMPVVEKIEDLRYCTEVSLFSCFIMAGDLLDSEMVIESHSNSKIKATYEAVVQFIQWYNNQQKQVKE